MEMCVNVWGPMRDDALVGVRGCLSLLHPLNQGLLLPAACSRPASPQACMGLPLFIPHVFIDMLK